MVGPSRAIAQPALTFAAERTGTTAGPRPAPARSRAHRSDVRAVRRAMASGSYAVQGSDRSSGWVRGTLVRAERIDLEYVSDDSPGIRRQRRGRGFSYVDPKGEVVKEVDRARIEALAIPPAWTEVWISPRPRAHLQATGRDAKGRKQYRYHPEWRRQRDADKFDHLLLF